MQTTTPGQADDCSIEEAGLRFDVVTRDRAPDSSVPDPVLSRLHESDFDELWLFALDGGMD